MVLLVDKMNPIFSYSIYFPHMLLNSKGLADKQLFSILQIYKTENVNTLRITEVVFVEGYSNVMLQDG